MRFRTRGEGSDPGALEHCGLCYLQPNNNVPQCPVDPIVVPYTKSRFSTGYVDVVTPNFKKRSAAGEVIINPMWLEYYHMDQLPTSYSATHKFNNALNHRSGDVRPATTGNQLLTSVDTTKMDAYLESLDVQSERDIAITKAWANVDTSEMAALASIGELPETLTFLKDSFLIVLKLLRIFRSKKEKLKLLKSLRRISPSDFTRESAQLWMQLRYALRPLMFEMEQVATVLADGTDPLRRTARGYYETSVVETTDVTVPFKTGSNSTVDRHRVVTRKSKYRAGVTYDLSASGTDMIELLGLDQPLSAIWELVTLSFLLDWIWNIGEFISSREVSSSLTPKGSWIKEEHTITVWDIDSNLHLVGGTGFTSTVDDVVYGSIRETRHLIRRSVDPTMMSYPHFRLKLDGAKLIDIAALIRNVYAGIH